MSNIFQQTVNLREKMEQDKERMLKQPQQFKQVPPAPNITQAEKKAKEIDKVYKDEDDVNANFQKISRPVAQKINELLVKRIVMILMVIVVAGTSFWLFSNRGNVDNKQNGKVAGIVEEPKWYAVTLVSGEIYYGLIMDVKANPLELDKVYYDYDQETKKDEAATDTGNIRLVKKGKEAYGPSGKMLIYQAQVKTVDELADDSKVLNAIKEYEAKK